MGEGGSTLTNTIATVEDRTCVGIFYSGYRKTPFLQRFSVFLSGIMDCYFIIKSGVGFKNKMCSVILQNLLEGPQKDVSLDLKTVARVVLIEGTFLLLFLLQLLTDPESTLWNEQKQRNNCLPQPRCH